MKSAYPFIIALCVTTTGCAASQLVKEETGLKSDWLAAMHANWQDSSIICLANRAEDRFVHAYVLPGSVSLDDLTRLNTNVDFDELQRISEVAFSYDRVTNKSRLYLGKSVTELPDQLANARPGIGVNPSQAADKACRERRGFSVGSRYGGRLKDLVEEHLASTDAGKTVYRLAGQERPLPVESLTEQGPQWRIKIDLAGQKTTARELVERGRELARSVVGAGVQAETESMQVRPSPCLSGLVENAWYWELTTVEGDNLLVVVDWRAPRTADDDSPIPPGRPSATLIVSKRWK